MQGDESVHQLQGDQAPGSQPFLPKKKKKREKKNVSWDSQTYSHYRQWAGPPISAGQLLVRASRWGAHWEHKGARWHRLRAVKMQRSGATPGRVGRRGKSVGKKREVEGGEKEGERETYGLDESRGNPGTPETDVPGHDTGTNVQVPACQLRWGFICQSALKGPRPYLIGRERLSRAPSWLLKCGTNLVPWALKTVEIA